MKSYFMSMNPKIFCALILVGCTSALTATASESAKTSAPSHVTLDSVKTFKLFMTGGSALDIPADGTPVKQLPENPKVLDGLVYTITAPDKALMIGNVGSSEVLLMPRAHGQQFFERTPEGNVMILEIYDQWNAEKGGFYCVYRRSTYYSTGRIGALVSTFWGYAKPWE